MHMSGFLAWAGTAKAVPAHSAMMANGHAGFLVECRIKAGAGAPACAAGCRDGLENAAGKESSKRKAGLDAALTTILTDSLLCCCYEAPWLDHPGAA